MPGLYRTEGSRPRIAAVVTEYRTRSHAENIVNLLLEGYALHWVRVPPRVDVVSLYTDQVPANDISREIAARHNVPLYSTIQEALTGGDRTLSVDGVVLVGEHGDYPYNEKGQHCYPRRRFFEETVDVFRRSGRVVPVFSDKHLSYNWTDAKWMYDTAQAMGIPLMAGSSMPLSYRSPPVQVPLGAGVDEIVAVGYGGLESYGFHMLECAQCLAERRQGHETGVAEVQCLTGDAFWDAWHSGRYWSQEALAAALEAANPPPISLVEWYAGRRDAESLRPTIPATVPGGPAQLGSASEPAAFLVEYRDGLRLRVLMLNGYARRRSVAVRLAEPPRFTGPPGSLGGYQIEGTLFATWFVQAREHPLWHFCHQVDHIERMMISGVAPSPIERTLLTTGMIDALMTSRYQSGRRLDTPHLAISYQPSG